ncbi:metal-dependent transcriptional regulator [Deinococcus budaensis]|uniref:Manganese transport regulator n=1 Tax=Deinococcus budaensis TaxID=1665626 RepID=A0A7W8GEU7_9DEIO|nr:metal-dependent transcriptional regulator [Deinococcus budaensis]MBB5234326.1 DtxR family Mn-dependent transcriptional regulator [Deinococcus budaensis]
MASRTLSPSAEDYLKQLYLLGRAGTVGTQALADALNVTPASTTGMLRKLTELGLVNHAAYRGASLTPAGERVALEVLRHHRLLELYLHRALGYPLDEVHDEAERLEHVISETFEARIAAWLGDPAFDPHGAPIPGLNGELPALDERPLGTLELGEGALITQVPEDPAVLRALMDAGLTPGVAVKVLRHDLALGTLTLEVDGMPLTLALAVAGRVRVSGGVPV